jgi:membrane associated rhomboid family serine protease
VIFALPLYDDNPIQRAPVVTWGLIGICVGAYLWQLGQDEEAVIYQYGMIPAVLFGHAQLPSGLAAIPAWVTIFTSMFLHGGFLHLGGNMLFLWIFGNNIEDVLGASRYLLLYLVSGVAAAMAQALPDPSSEIPMVGASGAIAGVLGAYLMLYPRANVHVFVWIVIFFRIVAVPAWVMLGFWFLLQLVSGISAGVHSPGVAFWAHAAASSPGSC